MTTMLLKAIQVRLGPGVPPNGFGSKHGHGMDIITIGIGRICDDVHKCNCTPSWQVKIATCSDTVTFKVCCCRPTCSNGGVSRYRNWPERSTGCNRGQKLQSQGGNHCGEFHALSFDVREIYCNMYMSYMYMYTSWYCYV